MAEVYEVSGSIGTDLYYCTIHWRNGNLFMDEPENLGGKDRGPDPMSTLLASLAGCTLSTLRMYIDRKKWNVSKITVNLKMNREEKEGKVFTTIDRKIGFEGEISSEDRERLVVIATKCPVSKVLEGEVKIPTSL